MPRADLFADAGPALPALAALAARAVPRAALQLRGYRAVAKSTDLHPHGYTVVHWCKPGVRESELLEFVPYTPAGRTGPALPRLTAGCYADQKAIHEAIGARVVSPGRRFLP